MDNVSQNQRIKLTNRHLNLLERLLRGMPANDFIAAAHGTMRSFLRLHGLVDVDPDNAERVVITEKGREALYTYRPRPPIRLEWNNIVLRLFPDQISAKSAATLFNIHPEVQFEPVEHESKLGFLIRDAASLAFYDASGYVGELRN